MPLWRKSKGERVEGECSWDTNVTRENLLGPIRGVEFYKLVWTVQGTGIF